ncbi:MAG: outer membrane lipoprotein-sorting protein [Bacteroidia bacterium]|nr:MAG: outer membrane lipoprotein-sorting protein [Bacteroidia bacterium]
MKTLKIMITLLFTSFLANTTFAEDAGTILREMDEVLFAGEDQTSNIRMILTDRNGNERVREAQVWQKGSSKRLFRFTAPAAEAGIAFLSLPDDVMYLYMPAYGRERRIASHVKNQSFAGTDFSYEDLEVEKYVNRFTPKLLEETDETYILELTPLPDMRSDYSKIIAHIHKTHYYPLKMESFDRGGQPFKVAEYTFRKQEDYWYTAEIKMTNLRRDHNTRMIFEGVAFDTGLDDSVFSVRNLTRH